MSPSGWVLPTAGRISSVYGNRVNPVTGRYSFHAGVDIAGGCGLPIYAAQSGTVGYSGTYGGYGNYIAINHGGGVTTAYGHIVNGGLLVSRGQTVQAGQIIARVGSTGQSTGCHLHYEVRSGSMTGSTQNPVAFMAARGVGIG